MTSKITATGAAFTFAAVLVSTIGSADARSRHYRRHHAAQARATGASTGPVEEVYAPARRVPIPYAYSFYPEEIEGGVSGNLPFNNQIRKSKDPLNANGGGG